MDVGVGDARVRLEGPRVLGSLEVTRRARRGIHGPRSASKDEEEKGMIICQISVTSRGGLFLERRIGCTEEGLPCLTSVQRMGTRDRTYS